MRKLYFLFITFALVLSCSSDETSTPVTPPPAPIVKYTITLSAGEGGTVSTTGGEYEAGQTVSVTATPQGEYLFKDWSDGNTDATRTITVNSNSTLTANFEKKKYPLTVNIEGEGEVLEEIVNAGRTTDYDSGTIVKLTAVPADCWSFNNWAGDFQSEEIIIEINVSSPKTINVSFNENPKRVISNFNDTSYLTNNYYDLNFNNILSDEGGYNNPLEAVVLDYNMDGFLDLIHTNSDYYKSSQAIEYRNKIKFYLGDCDGKYVLDENLSDRFSGLIHGRKGLIGDFNKDGFPDVFFIGHGIDTSPYSGEYPILLTNLEGLDFEITRFENLIGFFHTGASGDYDNDGDLDIVLTSISKTYILENSNGKFNIIEDDVNYDQRAITQFTKESIVPIIDQVFTSELYDINKDGFLDYVIAGHDWGESQIRGTGFQARILYGNGSSFLKGESLLPTINGYGVVLDINFFDIDNNGTTEIILSRTGDDVNGQGWYKGWYIQVLEIENSLYIDKTNKFIDDFSSPNDYENYRLHIAEIDGEIKLFNDQFELKQDGYNDDIKYKVWKLISGKFILQ
jgi:hypothetical protein